MFLILILPKALPFIQHFLGSRLGSRQSHILYLNWPFPDPSSWGFCFLSSFEDTGTVSLDAEQPACQVRERLNVSYWTLSIVYPLLCQNQRPSRVGRTCYFSVWGHFTLAMAPQRGILWALSLNKPQGLCRALLREPCSTSLPHACPRPGCWDMEGANVYRG